MLSRLLSMKKADLKAKVQSIDATGVKSRGLRRKFERIRNKEGGFTLLELLVVVAILAAIAGVGSVMLQDTDRKQAAGAHVNMMAGLAEGIQKFRVINAAYPDVWDSLITNSTNTTTSGSRTTFLSDDLAAYLSGATVLTTPETEALHAIGITQVRVLDQSAQGGQCAEANIKNLIWDKGNNVTAQNIFRPPVANGCGYPAHAPLGVMADPGTGGDPSDPGYVAPTVGVAATALLWTGAPERVGVPLGETPRLVAFGVGADSTLFNPSIIGALTNVPVYRHVAADEYNRFIVLFNLSNGEATFQAIVDGAGDTKDEELGELDNTRAT